MKMLSMGVLLSLAFVAGCAATEATDDNVPEAAGAAPTANPDSVFKTAEDFDPDDVASIRERRNRWVDAFAAGDADAVNFVFEREAVTALPDDIQAMSADEFFAAYDAEIAFDESSERFVTDGGDPRVMTKLPWVSYYADYDLTLTPKGGGEPVENAGRFMTRFRRQADDSLEVIRGPSVGDPAPLFALNNMKSGGEVELAGLLGEKPVVLVFGSYT